MSIEVENLDKEPVIVKAGTFFHLWCCDCRLRHIVFVDKVGSEKIKIGLVRDDIATKNARKLHNVVVHEKSSKKRVNAPKKSRSSS